MPAKYYGELVGRALYSSDLEKMREALYLESDNALADALAQYIRSRSADAIARIEKRLINLVPHATICAHCYAPLGMSRANVCADCSNSIPL